MAQNSESIKERALGELLKVPRGKVVAYGELARRVGTGPRAVGKIMAGNKEPDVYPCYKVVRSDGRLGGYSGAGGLEEEMRRLKKDGVEISDGRIDLERFGWK